MIVFGTCVGADTTRYEKCALPSIRRVALAGDQIWTASGSAGICRAYNELLDRACQLSGCEGVVLVHDDVELVDTRSRDKVVSALSGKDVAIVGVVGGVGLRSLAWWHARRTCGAVFETRGYTNFGSRSAEVDAVDGMFLALAPGAFASLRFDDESFPHFHGYDVDYCLQARHAGLRVVVAPIDLLHRTKTGYGSKAAFREAAAALADKWPAYIRPGPIPLAGTSALVAGQHWVRHRARRQVRAVAVAALKRAGGAQEASMDDMPTNVGVNCPICAQPVEPPAEPRLAIVECVVCGVGITWPPPSRDVAGEGLFKESYGGLRLVGRRTWIREGRLRVDWLKTLLPDGCVLDVGAATGEFVRAAADAGYDAYGVEVSAWAARHARRLGVDVVDGRLSDWIAQRPGVRPDAVTMWHVLEHVSDPALLLREIAGLLDPAGWLVLEVPNFDASDAEALGLEWSAAHPHDHFHHFRERSLRALLEQSGYEVHALTPMSRRVYTPAWRWSDQRNEALMAGRVWPSFDFLRAAARVKRLA